MAEDLDLNLLRVFDALMVLGPEGPDGQSTVINSDVATKSYYLVQYLENGAWLVGEVTALSRTPGVDQCATG